MFSNFLRIAVRNMLKQRVFSFVNIIGLTVGLAAVLLIALDIRFEYSFNSFNKNANHIYRVGTVFEREGKVVSKSSEFVAALGPAMVMEFPEVRAAVRLSAPDSKFLTYDNRSISIRNVMYADSNFFDVFSFHLIEGEAKNALVAPYSIVLTRSTASIIFGHDEPLGKVVTIENTQYSVTGIVKDPPSNSDIQFGAIISFSTLVQMPGSDHFLGWYGGNQFITYVELRKNVSADMVNRKFPAFLLSHFSQLAKINLKFNAHLEPLNDIHIYYNDNSAVLRRNLNAFSIIALFILLIACANFVNLSTARATGRAKEVGIRRTLGALREFVVLQFLAESILFTIIALLLAISLAELLLPWYNDLLGWQITFSSLFDGQFILFVLVVLLITGVLAGFYPALFMASYEPVKVLKGNLVKGKGKLLLRKSLVIFQFSISIVLLVSTFIINNQLIFLRASDLGFDKKDILVLSLDNSILKSRYEVFKNELRRISGVVDAAASTDVPGYGLTSNGYLPQGYKSPIMIHVVGVDEDFLSTYGIKLIKGRDFSSQIGSDHQAYIVNESLAKLFDWTNPLGKEIMRDTVHSVIGEVRNFNYAPLYSPIAPLIITDHPNTGSFNFISVKLGPGDLHKIMSSIQKVWHEFAPSLPFDYFFLDQQFDHIYRTELRFRKTFLIFSGLAMFVASLGLLGLVSYSIELRRKEIGIRKVLGSSVGGVISLLSKEYLNWVIAANAIAWPVAFIIMKKWLENFAYRTKIAVWVFVLSAVIVAFVALITISFEAVKAAKANTVESLRCE